MPDQEMNKLHELLETFETAMLVTHGSDSPHHARPMAIAEVEPNCSLWFFTRRSSATVDEIQNDQRVLIVCQNERRRYVALRGTAKLISDGKRAAELWDDEYHTWFPKGASDPDLLLIRVDPVDAEYWDNTGFQSVEYLFQAAKEYVRGTRPHVEQREQHGTVSFNE